MQLLLQKHRLWAALSTRIINFIANIRAQITPEEGEKVFCQRTVKSGVAECFSLRQQPQLCANQRTWWQRNLKVISPAGASGDNCEKARLSQTVLFFLNKPLCISHIHAAIYMFYKFVMCLYHTPHLGQNGIPIYYYYFPLPLFKAAFLKLYKEVLHVYGTQNVRYFVVLLTDKLPYFTLYHIISS